MIIHPRFPEIDQPETKQEKMPLLVPICNSRFRIAGMVYLTCQTWHPLAISVFRLSVPLRARAEYCNKSVL
jgi:hypothetical protein